MNHKLEIARSFALDDWRTLTQSWVLLLAVDLGLRVLTFPRVQAFAAQPGRRAHGTLSEDRVARMRRIVDMAARHHLYPMTCLRQALVLQRMLRVRGADAALRIGVRKENGALEAHAWVEYDGQVVGCAEMAMEKFALLLVASVEG